MINSHAPGTFSWPELSTTDQKGGVAFYRGLFGWDVTDMPMGPDGVYSIFKLRGLDVAAASTLRPDQQQHGVPPHWMSYIAVASADDAAGKATSLGATVLAAPFDVFDAGRMAVIQDPTGAVFCVWQAKKNIGIRVKNEVGALGWTELMTTDLDKARDFYVALFGWTMKESGHQGMTYIEFANAGEPQGGMMPMPPGMEGVPSHWTPYFVVSDCKGTTAQTKADGGSVMLDSMAIEHGFVSALADPQGAHFAIVQLAR